MEIHFTARRFQAQPELKLHAIDAVKKLDRYYDGIRRCDIILSYHRSTNSIKCAEINLHVNKTILTARENSEDFFKSIDRALDKLERRLETYKAKLRTKDKKTLRRARSKAV